MGQWIHAHASLITKEKNKSVSAAANFQHAHLWLDRSHLLQNAAHLIRRLLHSGNQITLVPAHTTGFCFLVLQLTIERSLRPEAEMMNFFIRYFAHPNHRPLSSS